MGVTPNILQKIGLSPLPLAMTKNHIYSVAVSDTRAKSEGRYHKNTNYHDLGFNTVKDIYNKISNPLMIIAHPDFENSINRTNRDSAHKIIVLVDLSVNRKQVIAPISIDFEGKYNNTIIDVNLVSTYFNKNNINDLIKEAVALETTGKIGFYYLDKKRTQSIFKRTGYQLPRTLNNLSSNVIIRTIDDNVNRKINNITQSQQFKRWFGDWQNKPQNASKAVDRNGEPLVLYHQTEKEYTTYASIKNPLIVNNRSELVNFYDKNVQGYTKAKSAIDTARENITEQTEVKNSEKIDVEKFSIADDIVDDNGTHYGKGVVLDTKIFKNKKPRDWGKILKKFVYDNLAGKQITVFDENNNERVIEFARLNERVKKDGANNPHKVIDKLARKTDNNSRLAVAHSAEIVEVSNFESNNPTHTHQWLDENGWEYRNVYLINRKGEIYKVTLNIGKSKDGRNILYDINKISNIGHGVVFSNGVEKIDTKRNSLINPNVVKTNVSQNIKNVNEKFSLDEDYDFSDPSKLDERELKIYNNRGWSYGLFNKEDMALLSEKVRELKKDWHKADNALWDGSRLVEINNKLVILGGTYKNPEIYNVLVINANQETDAEFIKEDFYFEFNRCKKFREVVANICKSIEIMQGEELVKFYDSIDYISIRLIISIKRGEGEIGYQQRYQAILKITDILKGVTSDTEARSELEKAFPQYS